jgi:hypothetical protein
MDRVPLRVIDRAQRKLSGPPATWYDGFPDPKEVRLFERRYAARGAAFMDEAVPGWFERVDYSTIDLRSWQRCILGQVYGHFEGGCDALGLTYERTKKLGFWTRPFHNRMLLELYWAKEVQARQHASKQMHLDLAKAEIAAYDYEVHGL